MLSAAPVGRMVLRLFEVADPRAVPLSDDVCVGLQLANFAQDVAIDRGKGRTYLIQSELDRLGLPGAVEAMCERALLLLRSGRELERLPMPARLRLQLSLYRRGGEAILEAIRRDGFRTDLRRPEVSTATKLRLVASALSGGPLAAPSGDGRLSAASGARRMDRRTRAGRRESGRGERDRAGAPRGRAGPDHRRAESRDRARSPGRLAGRRRALLPADGPARGR